MPRPQATKRNFWPLTDRNRALPGYTPGALLDKLSRLLGARNDAQLAHKLGLPPTLICRLRSRQVDMTAAHLVRFHDVARLSIEEMRKIAHIPDPPYFHRSTNQPQGEVDELFVQC